MEGGYQDQSLEVSPPSALELWIASPTLVAGGGDPRNLLRIWLPEAVTVDRDGEQPLPLYTKQEGAHWVAQTRGVSDMKRRRPTRQHLRAVDTLGDLALMTREVLWRGEQADLEIRLRNTGRLGWDRLRLCICLQRTGAPDFADVGRERTYLLTDRGFLPVARLAPPDHGAKVFCEVGQPVRLEDESAARITEGVFFVQSEDGRYVLCYAWRPAWRIVYHPSACVNCLHVDPAMTDVPPHAEASASGLLFVAECSLEDACRRYRAWAEV
ncbi:MAG: hypothetical protein CMJ18_00325 [Phycisphaeraceae bacterium]|nr:hypothetical protein [Phycisphaeraceae bacterium]